MAARAISFFSDSVAEIPSLDLVGGFTKSPNNRYVVVFSDSDPSRGIGGYRESGLGRYVLLHDEHIVVTGSLERPNDGQVANTGTFILSDWLFGDQLASVFYVFSNRGEPLIRHEFAANIFSSGISEDGRHAACQLCNSSSDDGGRLVIFDIEKRRVEWRGYAESGWPQSYVFDTAARRLGLEYQDRCVFWYSMSGEFLDRTRWQEAQIRFGSGYEVLNIARERLQAANRPLTSHEATDLLTLIDLAVARLKAWPREQAKAERFAGEVHEARGDVTAAIERYESAVALDPRCGIKRRLQSLKEPRTAP